jgi:hypothetical protein
MDVGSRPQGELYLTPFNKESEAWLCAHYYSGGTVKLLKFKKPLESPETNSPLDRLNKMEERELMMLNIIKQQAQLIASLNNTVNSAHLTSLDSGNATTNQEISKIDSEISTLTNLIANHSELSKNSNASYLVSNIELSQSTRGW